MHDQEPDMVDPSMYPLIYGRSRMIKNQTASVGVEEAIDKWAGKGEVLPVYQSHRNPRYVKDRMDWYQSYPWVHLSASLWSKKYQWLPADVEIDKDGSAKFTSYINNIHPIQHRAVYHTIEKLIERVFPAWDQCLVEHANLVDMYGSRVRPMARDSDEDNGHAEDEKGEDEEEDEYRRLNTAAPRPAGRNKPRFPIREESE